MTHQPMDEAEWLACDDVKPMLSYLSCLGSRKRRNLLCGCCRRVEALAPDSFLQEAIGLAEAFADGTHTRGELVSRRQAALREERARTAAERTAEFAHGGRSTQAWTALLARHAAAIAALVCKSRFTNRDFGFHLRDLAIYYAWAVTRDNTSPIWSDTRQAVSADEERVQCNLVRDVFGNHFRPVRIDRTCLQWDDGLVVKLARGVYDDRAFDRMPILADALEDAGCCDEQILNHCRSAVEHVRGCWLVDQLLGKD
jgi:hypothetical protein